jgi:hypothetical protein
MSDGGSAVGQRKSLSLLEGSRPDAVRWYAASSVLINLAKKLGPLVIEEEARQPFDLSTASISQQGPLTPDGFPNLRAKRGDIVTAFEFRELLRR